MLVCLNITEESTVHLVILADLNSNVLKRRVTGLIRGGKTFLSKIERLKIKNLTKVANIPCKAKNV